jgi:hypothetical protein
MDGFWGEAPVSTEVTELMVMCDTDKPGPAGVFMFGDDDMDEDYVSDFDIGNIDLVFSSQSGVEEVVGEVRVEEPTGPAKKPDDPKLEGAARAPKRRRKSKVGEVRVEGATPAPKRRRKSKATTYKEALAVVPSARKKPVPPARKKPTVSKARLAPVPPAPENPVTSEEGVAAVPPSRKTLKGKGRSPLLKERCDHKFKIHYFMSACECRGKYCYKHDPAVLIGKPGFWVKDMCKYCLQAEDKLCTCAGQVDIPVNRRMARKSCSVCRIKPM